MGSLEGAPDAAVSIGEDREIVFTWQDDSLSRPSSTTGAHPTDQVMLLAYPAGARFSVEMLSGARRSAGREILKIARQIPRKKKWHIWIAFISDNREHVSNSEYLGVVEM